MPHTFIKGQVLADLVAEFTEPEIEELPSFKTVLQSANYTGRIAKWGTILGAFDIKYMPRTSIKGKVLADLVAEFTEPEIEELPSIGNMDEKLVGTISQYRFPT